MATTEYGVNHPLAQKLWSKMLQAETLKRTYFRDFMGSGSDALIQEKIETKKNPGDQVTFGLRMQLTGLGVQGDSTAEGNEEALSTFSDALLIDQTRHAVRSRGQMSQERVPFSVRREARDGLSDWWADRLDTSLFNQLCGMVNVTQTLLTGNNAVSAPSANNIMMANPARANEAALTTGDDFTLAAIDRAVARARTMVPMIRPLRVNGKSMYVVFVHPFQTAQLRQQPNPGQWADLNKALLQGGGDAMSNPIMKGGDLVGIYNNCIIYESARIPNGLNASNVPIANVRRAVLCGAQAAVVGFGTNTSGPDNMFWREKMFDYDNQLGVLVGGVFGVKKTRFNSADFGTIVISSNSPAI